MQLTNEQQAAIHELLATVRKRLNNIPLLVHRGGDEEQAEIAHAKAELDTIKKMIGKPIIVGSVVKYGEGWYKVKSLWKKDQFANLCGVFTDHIHHKQVPLADLMEDHDAWYENWTQSETYKSM
jgi:hypothetical protein